MMETQFDSYFTSYEVLEPPIIEDTATKLIKLHHDEFIKGLSEVLSINTTHLSNIYSTLKFPNQENPYNEYLSPEDEEYTEEVYQQESPIDFSPIRTNFKQKIHNENLNRIYVRMKLEGYNDAQISGVLANIICESGGDPTAINASKHWGLAQWSSMQNVNGRSRSFESQLDYLMSDIKISGWSKSKSENRNGFSPSHQKTFMNTDNPVTAANAFGEGYERYGNAAQTKLRERISYSIYNIIKDGNRQV